MNILIIGGTIFLGRHIVNSALKAGHKVTMFNRGQHNPELHPEAERITGDRKTDLDLLKGRKWDVVIDTCGYAPSVVKLSAEALKDLASHYIFISTISVYADLSADTLNEDSQVGVLKEPTEEVTGESYGPLKVLCENETIKAFPDNYTIIRPGLIVGPDDPTDRFTYWVDRINKEGKVLAPDAKKLPVQFIDVRDLADWTVRMAEKKQTGIYNATGPAEKIRFEETLERIKAALNSNAVFEWVSEKFLEEKNIAPWSDLPLWVPEVSAGFSRVDISRALEAGLKLRPVEETSKDIIEWMETRKEGYDKKEGLKTKAGISLELEKELLKEYSSQS